MTIQFHKIVNLFFASVLLGSGIGFGSIYLFHLMLGLVMLGWLFLSMKGKILRLRKPNSLFAGFLLFMVLWYALSLAWAPKLSYGLTYLVCIIFGVLTTFFFVAWTSSQERYLAVFKILKIVAIAGIVISILEIFTPFRLPTSPYSEYAVFFNRKATQFDQLTEVDAAVIKTAPTSFTANPNNLAILMLMMLPFTLFFQKSVGRLLILLSILIALIFSGSRGAFVALPICIFAYMILSFKIKRLVWIFLCLGIGVTILILNIDRLKTSEDKRIAELAYVGDILVRYVFETDESGGSISQRQILMKNGMAAFWNSNGLGIGSGGSQAVQEQIGGRAGELGSMHNFWVETLVEGGVIFWLPFVFWYIFLTARLYRIFKRSNDYFFKYFSGSLFVALVTFSISCVSASSVIYFLPMWLMFGMSISLLKLYQKARNHKRINSISV